MSLYSHTRLATGGRVGVHNFGFVHTLCTSAGRDIMGMLTGETEVARVAREFSIIYNPVLRPVRFCLSRKHG